MTLATSEYHGIKSTSRDATRRKTVRSKRHGYSLIELLMTISLGTMVLGTAIIAVVMLMKMCSAERAHWQSTAARGRLERQFREDARAASEWNLAPDDGSLCLFRFSDGSVTNYRQDADAIIRLRLNADQTPTRERYVLLPNTKCQTTLLEESLGASFLRLTIDAPLNVKNEEVRRRYRTVVSAGADHRFVENSE